MEVLRHGDPEVQIKIEMKFFKDILKSRKEDVLDARKYLVVTKAIATASTSPATSLSGPNLQ